MGRNGIRTTVGLPGSGLSYSRRVSSGASLVPGIALAGLLLLVVSAARGNRFARITLICIGIAILVLFATAALQNTTVTVSPARYSIGTPPPATPVPERDKTPPPSDMIQSAAAAPLAAWPSEVAVITTTGANVRSAPSMSGKALRQLPVGANLMIVKVEGNWATVRDEGSGEVLGWVHRSLLKVR